MPELPNTTKVFLKPICCEHEIVNSADIDLFSDHEIDNLITHIAAGMIGKENLPYNVYKKTAEKLTDGVFKGYGKDFGSELLTQSDLVFLNSLRENVYVFSAAKTYQEVRAISSLMVDSDGNRIPFTEFKEQAKQMFHDYNQAYLKTEYDCAIGQSRSASLWNDIQQNKETLSMLVYQTVEDDRVRPEHAELDGIARPVDDPFWDNFMPPNDWGCRCIVIQEDESVKETDLSTRTIDEPPPLFQMNSGKDKIVFKEDHPYFDVARGDKELAKINFGLPLPDHVNNG